MRESAYQSRLIKRLYKMFPNCIVLKNDSDYIQGIPDLLILFQDRWAALEVKASKTSKVEANQTYYINVMNDLSFAAFIHPDNEKDVLSDLQHAFSVRR